jgi:hypothetical protein
MKYLKIFKTQEDLELVKDSIQPPYVVYVEDNHSIGMHNDKSLVQMFNFQDKTVTVAEQGTIVVTPDDEYSALREVTINSEVSSGGNKLPNMLYLYHGSSLYNEFDGDVNKSIYASLNLDTFELEDKSFEWKIIGDENDAVFYEKTPIEFFTIESWVEEEYDYYRILLSGGDELWKYLNNWLFTITANEEGWKLYCDDGKNGSVEDIQINIINNIPLARYYKSSGVRLYNDKLKKYIYFDY